jgi:predicted metal-dependent hydrolase
MGIWSSLFNPALLPQPRRKAVPRQAATFPGVPEPKRTSSVGIDYTLERGKRRSIGLVITTDGLLIRAPKWTPIYEIDAAIAERREWIEVSVEKQRARLAKIAEFRDGGHVLFRGHKLKIELRQGLFDSVDLTERHCVLTTQSGLFDADLLNAEIKRIAQLELPAMARELAADASLPLNKVVISTARTMWGSCTIDGNVRLNFRLIQLDPALTRHVVAHELAHLIEFNHSKRFWTIVEKLDPKTKTHKRAIKTYAVLLEL